MSGAKKSTATIDKTLLGIAPPAGKKMGERHGESCDAFFL